MSIKRRKLSKGIRIKPNDMVLEADGEITVDSDVLGEEGEHTLKVKLSNSDKTIITKDQTQTVTNKSIDADNNTISNIETDNLKAGVLNTDLSGAATDTEIPSALAVKTALAGQNEASEINYDNTASGLTATEVQSAIDEVEARVDSSETALSDHLVDAVDAHDASAISNVPTGNLAATDVQGALDELQSEIDALPAKTETLQNKTLDSTNTISGSIETPTRLDVKQDTEANLITYAATASDGQLCFATDTLKMYQIIGNELQPVGGGGSTSFEITQAAHGLTVGSGIYHNGTIYVDAQANNEATLAYHVVVEVIDANTFVAADFGRIEVPAHGFTIGEYYFQSEATAGLPTITQPVSGYSNPLFYVEDANTLQIKCLRPSPVGDTINLDELADVSVAAPTDGQALIYNLANLRWEATDVAATAADITYSNATSGLTATNTQAAIDEVEGRVDTNTTNISTNASNITSNDADIRNLEKVKNINYITNPDFEDGISGVTGDTNLIVSHETASPLRGAGSLYILKEPGADYSGQTIKIPFTIDTADLAKKLTITFDYDFSDLDYADGDARIKIIKDPAGTPVDISVNGEDIQGGKGNKIAQFQTDATELNYSLVIEWVSTTTGAVTALIDNIQVGPREVVKGAVMTDWKSYTPNLNSLTNVSRNEASYSRVGDKLQIQGILTYSGVGSATQLYIELPSGLLVDTVKLKYHATGTSSAIGFGSWTDVGVRWNNLIALLNSTADKVYFTEEDAGNLLLSSLFASGDVISYKFEVPIQGWSSNAVSSEDLGGREIVVIAKGNDGTGYTANTTNINFTQVSDSTASFDGTSFTAPESGTYNFIGGMSFTTDLLRAVELYLNGSKYLAIGSYDDISLIPFGGNIPLVKGDIVTLRVTANNGTLNNSTIGHHLTITKLASPQTILETETVAARYTSNSGQLITDSTITTVIYEDKVDDTHNAYNTSTGEYTVPVSGRYSISAAALFTAIALTSPERFEIFLYVNNVLTEVFDRRQVEASSTYQMHIQGGCSEIPLSKGDIVDMGIVQNTGSDRSLDAAPTYNVFSIARIK